MYSVYSHFKFTVIYVCISTVTEKSSGKSNISISLHFSKETVNLTSGTLEGQPP